MWRIIQLCVWWPLRLLLELLSVLSILVLRGSADVCMLLGAGLLRLSDVSQAIGDRVRLALYLVSKHEMRCLMGIADWGVTTELVSRRGFLCGVAGSVFKNEADLWTFTSLNLKTAFTCQLSAADGVLPALLAQARHELQTLLMHKAADAESPFCQAAEHVRGHRMTLFIPVYEPMDAEHALSALVLPRVQHSSKLDEGGRYLYHDDLKLRTAVCINGELISDSGNKCTAAIIYGPFDMAGDPGA